MTPPGQGLGPLPGALTEADFSSQGGCRTHRGLNVARSVIGAIREKAARPYSGETTTPSTLWPAGG